MKAFIFLALISFSLSTFSQDTTFFDPEWRKLSSLEAAHYYLVFKRDQSDTNSVSEKIYYRSGQIKSERNYNPYCERTLHGKRREWWENGQIRKDIDFENGRFSGELLTYWKDGKLKRKDVYSDGQLIEGQVWKADGQPDAYYEYEVMPYFPGGENELFKFLGKKIRYPKKSMKRNIQGIVLVNFIIQEDGSVYGIRVEKGINNELDAEAVKAVKKMPKWVPGSQDGYPISVSYNLPIKFTLNQANQ